MVRRLSSSFRILPILAVVGWWVGGCTEPAADRAVDQDSVVVDGSADASKPVEADPVEEAVEPPTVEPKAFWATRTGGEVWSAPVTVGDTAVAFGSDDGVLRIVERADGSVRHERRLGGRLRAAPTVVGAALVATSEEGAVHVVDVATGEIVWRRELGAAVPAIGVESAGLVVTVDRQGQMIALAASDGRRRWRGPVGTPHGAPASDGQRIVVVTQDGVVQAVGPSGRVAWRTEAGAETAAVVESGVVVVVGGGYLIALGAIDGVERWRARVGEFVGAPPAAADGRVWIAAGDGWLLAFDARSGAEVWRRRLDGPVRGSPAPTDDIVFLTVGEHRLIGLDATTGDGRWRFESDTWITGALSAVDGDGGRRVLFGAVDGRLYGVLAELSTITPAPRRAPAVMVGPSFFEGEPTVGWIRDLQSTVQASPIVGGQAVVVPASSGWFGLDPESGRRLWSVAGDAATAAPTLGRQTVYGGDLSGTLRAVAEATGETRWQRRLDGPIRSSVALGEGLLAVSTDAGLVVLDPSSGIERWASSEVGAAPPVITGGLVVGGGCRGAVAFDADRGRELWRHDLGGCVAGGLAALGDGAVAVDGRGRAVALEPAVGGARWQIDRLGGVRHRIAAALGTVLLPGDDGHLRGVDAISGVLRWSFDAGPRITSDVVTDDGIAYVGSIDGRLYAVNAINGDELWRVEMGVPIRGVALGRGRLIVAAGDGRVVAIDLP